MQHKHIQVLWCAVMDVMILVRPATLATSELTCASPACLAPVRKLSMPIKLKTGTV